MIEEALHILSDPGHVIAEAVFITIEAAVLSPGIAWLVRRHDRKHHPKDV